MSAGRAGRKKEAEPFSFRLSADRFVAVNGASYSPMLVYVHFPLATQFEPITVYASSALSELEVELERWM